MSVKKKSISTLIETQLPEFITSEYELFSKFVTKYYEQLEVQGGTLDVLGNIQTYADINYYEKNLLKQSSVLVGNHTDSTTTIIVEDATSFPEENGYIKIDDEICFYKERTNTQFLEVSRGVSGNTKLGDLYDTSTFVSTEAATHSGGSVVQNISNLFLYALIKSFEAQYLGAFPEKYLKGEVDKRTLIKNIRKFYQAKGTDASVRFIFNTLVAGGEENTPTQFFPKDFTYKSSESDWATGFALKAKVLSGNVQDLIGKVVTQKQTSNVPFASATVDNIRYDGTVDGEPIYNILLAEETVNGEFKVTSKTELTKALDGTAVAGDYINVFSTNGWAKSGRFLIGNEVFTFEDKNITQFRILTRQNQSSYTIGTPVYDPIEVSGSGVTLLVFGLVYNLNVEDGQPYASTGDKVEISDPGFSTSDTKIVDSNNNIRWKLSSQNSTVLSPSYQTVQQKLGQVSTDVSAVFEDEQYYYIASSGFPSHRILSNAIDAPTNVKDQRLLKLIRKQATRTTEIYKTPTNDVGVLVNGVRAFGFRDKEFVDFGKLESVRIDQRGIGYKIPPIVLVDGVEGKGRAVLAGEFVESVEIIGESLYPVTPTVEITSGRGARVKAIVTLGKITSLVVEDPGAYYTTPPIITIQDRIGRGRFAEYTANIENGKIVSFNQISEGDFYTQSNVEVVITPIGSGAKGTAQLKRWVKNTYKKFENKVDDDNGYLFLNYNEELEYGYGYLANPLALRVALNDNIDSLGVEPANKVHSPILGFAYDGNPIYGPFGYDNPLDASSSIERMSSSYSLKSTRLQGPPTSEYPLGSFIDDYAYSHASGSLDQNNGRFCVTPEFPEGTYAYFVTIQANQTPVYPYIIGENFYSLPVDSNYNSNLSQADLPKNASRLRVANTPQNGGNVLMTINDVKSGSIENIEVVDTHDNFSVGSGVVLNSDGTQGFGAEALVETVKGKNVNFLESRETKATRLEIVNPAYLFAGDRLTQPASGSYGEVVGDVKNDNIVVLRDVQGTFDTTNTFSSQIKVITLSLDKASSFRLGSIIKLTDGAVSNKAYGEVLETTAASNVVTVKVLETTDFNNDGIADIPSGTAPYYFASEEDLPDHYIASNNLADTNGAKIISFISLSDGLEPFLVDQNVALVETDAAHGIGIGDVINLQINPNDTLKTTTYYVRKRIYQNLDLVAPRFTTRVDYTGIGRLLTYNVGWDYTPGTYTNIPLTGGSGEDATANIVVGDDGYVTEVQISDGGSGYKRQDQLSVADASLIRSSASNSTQRLILFVDHVGVSNEATKIKVADATRFVNNDFATLDSEVIKILSKDGNLLTVERGQQNTTAVDHYNNAPVSLKDGKYNFASNFAVNGSDSFRYDEETQKVFVTYPPSTDINTLQPITSANSFFDSSTPRRNVEIDSASLPVIKFEFKRGTTGEWQENPIIEVQEYYKYVFDTSDTSLLGTYLDFSPSKSLNLIPVERNQSDVLPGNAGASTDLKFGFGSRTAQNQYDEKQLTEFTNFYYYDRNGICNSEGSYLSLIKDPLTGRKVVNYVTPTRFVYSLTKVPQYDGSGSITYTTSSIFSIGEIATVKLKNVGDNYKKAPIVEGAYPTETYLASATVLYDDFTKKIISVRVDNPGSNYSNPKVVITDGDGLDASFSVTHRDGKVLDIVVTNPGKGYTKAPSIGIVEGDTKMFATGANIGVPKNVSIIRNGSSFHQDKTLYSKYTSSYVLALKNYPEKAFKFGEIVIQKVNNVEVARGVVADNGWREGSNLLKVTKVRGNFRQNFSVESLKFGNSGVITQIYVTEFLPQITSTYDNVGSYGSDRGRIGNSNQRITDSFFYQDFSYVIRSKTPINIWRDLIKSTTHPAGMKLFGEVAIEGSTDSGKMPEKTAKAGHYSVIQLWDPEKNKITSDIKQRVVTQTVQKLEDYKSKKGRGAANVQEYNFTDLLSDPVKLASNFDGTFNDAGQLVGTRTFTMQHAENNSIIQPYNEQALIVTLDGVIQEPGVAYTISGNQITFAAPPLGEATVEGQLVPQQKFLARMFSFRDGKENSKVLKKIRNIFQRSGRWIDSANQINFNTDFIVLETVGWFESTYSSIISNNTLPWNILEPRFLDDVRLILQAIEHDIRFGGNAKTVDYAEIYKNSYDGYETYIENAFGYAIRLARMAILNWDWIAVNAEFNVSSDLITVQNTDNIALGAKVSAGSAFPLANEIEVTEIVSSTQVRVSSPPLYNSGVAPAGSASPGTTFLNGTQTQNTTLPTATGAVAPPNSYSVGPGTSLTAPPVFSGLNQVTFIYSGINNGTFYDASNLINKNREYITDYAVNWAKATYPLITWNTKETKCRRDIGYLLDAVIKHLRYGGNNDIVEFAELYFIGSQLKYIDDQLTETLATYSKVLTELCVNAIQQTLPGSPNAYTNVNPVIDTEVIADPNTPVCAQVVSALNSYYDIIDTIFNTGPTVVSRTKMNPTKVGKFTSLRPYANINIILDLQLISSECADVISSVAALKENISDIFAGDSVTRTTPDYIDGETKEFELYYENGDPVILPGPADDLLVVLNGVLQRNKFNPTTPAFDSYHIDRVSRPNKIVFTSPPIWDQDVTARTLGEPTAVEKFFAFNIGSYKRFTTDKSLIQVEDSESKGPFLIVGVEDGRVYDVSDRDYVLVLVDGVIQEYESAYTIVGPQISFKYPLKKENVVDIRLLYGKDYEKIVTLYDYEPQYYLIEKNLRFTNGYTFGGVSDQFADWYLTPKNVVTELVNSWMYQVRPDGTINAIGKPFAYYADGNDFVFRLRCNNTEIIDGLDITVGMITGGLEFTIDTSVYAPTLTTVGMDPSGVISLIKESETFFKNGIPRANSVLKRKGFFTVALDDQIKVDGEDKFRKIIDLPPRVYQREYYGDMSNSHYGTYEITSNDGTVRGEGLSVQAILEYEKDSNGNFVKDSNGDKIPTGKIESLVWNQKEVDFSDPDNPKIYKSTANQYYTPPILKFVSEDGEGGGARARVIVKGGSVISVDLIQRGFDYKTAPKVVVCREYKIRRSNDIDVNVIKLGINSVVQTDIVIASQVQPIALPPPEFAIISTVVLDSVVKVGDIIEAEIQLDESTAIPEEQPRLYVNTRRDQFLDVKQFAALDTDREIISVVSTRPVDITSVSTIAVSRVEATKLELQPQIAPGSTVETKFWSATKRNKFLEIQPAPEHDTFRKVISVVETTSPNVLSSSALTTSREKTVTINREIDNTFVENKNYYAAGAFLNANLPAGQSVVYIPDTSKFSSNGKLIVGTEIIYYPRKFSDRFVKCERAQEGTTEQSWIAGTYVRQLEDYVTVVPGGINVIESSGTVIMPGIDSAAAPAPSTTGYQVVTPIVTLQSSSRNITSEVQARVNVESISSVTTAHTRDYQIGTAGIELEIQHKQTTIVENHELTATIESSVKRDSTAVLIFTPPSGVIDFYVEEVVFPDPISTRLNGFISLVEKSVTQRSGNVIFVINESEGAVKYQGEYTPGNLGSNIGNWNNPGYDDGVCNVSNISIAEFARYFASVTIADFERRATSNFTLSGQKWNLANASIQNPVAISSSSGTIGGPIVVQDTTYFPNSGYLVSTLGSVIQYTSKTATTFEGCTLVRGTNTINANDKLVPFSID